jgi:hypothetical protein
MNFFAELKRRNLYKVVIAYGDCLEFPLRLLPSKNQRRQNRRCEILEIIADNLKKRGWSYGYVSAIDSNGRTIWIADAHRDDGKRFVVRANEKLTAITQGR